MLRIQDRTGKNVHHNCTPHPEELRIRGFPGISRLHVKLLGDKSQLILASLALQAPLVPKPPSSRLRSESGVDLRRVFDIGNALEGGWSRAGPDSLGPRKGPIPRDATHLKARF